MSIGLTACGEDANDEAAIFGIDESFLDKSVSPCTDFYQFACGTWLREHPTDKAAAVQRFSEGEGRSNYLLQKILENDRSRTPLTLHPGDLLLGGYYGACINDRGSTTVVHADLDDMLGAISSATSLADLGKVVARLHANGIDALFNLDALSDPADPSHSIATFSAGGMSLPDRRYYLDASMSVLPEYEEHVRRSAALFPTPAAVDPSIIVSVETKLAQALDADDNTGDPIKGYNLLAFDAFTASASSFPWASYLSAAGFPSLPNVNVRHPVYLMKFDAFWSAATLPEMKSYLSWRVLEAYAETMGSAFVTEEARFHWGVFYGDPTAATDSWGCFTNTKSAFAFTLSQPYVQLHFDSAKKSAAVDMIASIKRSFRSQLETRAWIDAPTRQEALMKFDKIGEQVGAPDVWPGLPPAITAAGHYQPNSLEVARWRRQKNIDSLAQTRDRGEWAVAPCTTNAFYSPSRNQILFPAAILQTPLFGVGRARAVNYGAIGAIVGHELTHGFDDDGRKFDGDGKLRSWWSPSTDQEFVRRSQCLATQFDGYEVVPGVHLDGQLTLGENIADLGGLKVAHAAYQSSGEGESLSGSYSSEQQFFISYAQMWCANFRDEISRSRVRTDPHAAPRFRVNGAVSNVPEFASAFACAAGSPMAPTDRCEVW